MQNNMALKLNSTEDKFDCVIIGDSTLVICCSEMIIERNAKILGIITECKEVIEWCNEYNVPYISYMEMSCIHEYQFHYLFSIVNYRILNSELLDLPQMGAINYHDALLPRYAGIHATSWALIHGEKYHGISWHEMKRGVDAGDILVQKKIAIEPNETTFTLNMKCYCKAVQGFEDLLDNICSNNVTVISQDVKDRKVYYKKQKPVMGGVINWGMKSEEIKNYVNAMNYGCYDNTFCTSKIFHRGKYYIVISVKISNELSTKKAGSFHIADGEIFISTIDYNIRINSIIDIYGNKACINDVFTESDGFFYSDLDISNINEIKKIMEDICRYEQFWKNRLLSIVNNDNIEYFEKINQCNIVENKISHGSISDVQYTCAELVIFVIANHINCTTSGISFVFGYFQQDRDLVGDNDNIFERYVPVILRPVKECSMKEQLNQIRKELVEVQNSKTYMKDIFYRYVNLRNKYYAPVVTICVSENDANIKLDERYSIQLFIDEQRRRCKCYLNGLLNDTSSVYLFFKEVQYELQGLHVDLSIAMNN